MTLNRLVGLLQFIKIVAIIFMTAFILFSCSPERRMSNLISKYPHLIKTDSVLVTDSVFIPSEKIKGEIADSSLFKATKDHPIVLDSGRVKTIIYRYDNKTFVESECKGDTAITSHYNITKYYPDHKNNIRNFDYLFFFLCFCSSILGCLFYNFLIHKR